MTRKNTICLWYDGAALDAARFYAKTFPDSAVGSIVRAPGDYPSGKTGDVLTVEFTVMGIPCLGLNGGPEFSHNEAFSFQVATDDQAETDRLWHAIVRNGGQESVCGWCKDKWGVSWQIIPRVLTAALADPDRAAARRAFEAMMGMVKIDVAEIERARKGQGIPRAQDRGAGGGMKAVILESTLTCPECGHVKTETMPTDACQWFYECEQCHTVLKPRPGDCCVFCSYGTVPCPPVQAHGGGGCCGA